MLISRGLAGVPPQRTGETIIATDDSIIAEIDRYRHWQIIVARLHIAIVDWFDNELLLPFDTNRLSGDKREHV